MKVILLEDVKALGKKGQVVDISDGYAKNVILKKKLGLEANSANMNELKLQKAREEKIAKQQLEAARELAAALEGKSVTVQIKAGENGKAFGSVSSKEIAAAYQQQCGLYAVHFFGGIFFIGRHFLNFLAGQHDGNFLCIVGKV